MPMVAVDARGVRVSARKRTRPRVLELSGNDSEMRGIWAKKLISKKWTRPMIARFMKISIRQVYRDLEAADAWLEERTRAG